MKRLIITILISLLCLPVYAQQGLEQIRIVDFSKGMNSFDLPNLIPDNQGASMVNVVVNRFGRLSKRKGQNLFNVDVGSTAFTGIGRFDPDRTTSYLSAASGTAIIASLANDVVWRWTNPASPLTAGLDTEFIQANNLLMILNGYDSPAYWTGSYFQETSGVYPTSPPTAKTGAWLRNYLFLAGNPTNQDWLYFSNNLEPLKFYIDDVLKINTGDGQSIQRLMPFRLNELIVYKTRSIFILDITGATPLVDWTVQPISTVIGTIAPRSIVSLGNDQWFLSSEPIAVRSLARTQFDKILVDMVSKPIQDIFEQTNKFGFNINKTHVSKACAILYNNKYLLAVPTGTSTVNNTVLVYDFLTQAWYIIKGWYPADWKEFDNRLFYIDANDGRAIECFVGTTGDYEIGPTAITSESVPSTGIEYVYISKSIDYDKPEVYKAIDALEVEFEPTGDYNATVYINLDNEGWQRVGTVNLAGQSVTLPVTLPTQLSNSGTARKTFQLQQYGEFKKMQFMITNSASQQSVELNRVSIFARPKAWRRE